MFFCGLSGFKFAGFWLKKWQVRSPRCWPSASWLSPGWRIPIGTWGRFTKNWNRPKKNKGRVWRMTSLESLWILFGRLLAIDVWTEAEFGCILVRAWNCWHRRNIQVEQHKYKTPAAFHSVIFSSARFFRGVWQSCAIFPPFFRHFKLQLDRFEVHLKTGNGTRLRNVWVDGATRWCLKRSAKHQVETPWPTFSDKLFDSEQGLNCATSR